LKTTRVIDFLPDGTALCSGMNLEFFDIATGEKKPDKRLEKASAHVAAVAPDQSLLAISNVGHNVLVASLAPKAGKAREMMAPKNFQGLSCLAFSTDGKRLAGLGGSFRGERALVVWDTKTGKVLAQAEKLKVVGDQVIDLVPLRVFRFLPASDLVLFQWGVINTTTGAVVFEPQMGDDREVVGVTPVGPSHVMVLSRPLKGKTKPIHAEVVPVDAK
jgi:hypothetical protein